ncbi:MAG: hypothetical protein OM95_02325 [Bdellovibrio sp. ArHS]|uniref:hypothetical protein n=1 Tax=Bdellovibrio sp. ArHS TaxID=1569284 RepID=UPI0005839FBF|nr:hypothetical protein [Bdellovibrio sp. ArHS]KHD89589.1 MAG: hypothetical protein OM95_02325 [Bdellovibrio sp. ArHS]
MKALWLLFSVLGLVACANPDYVSDDDQQVQNKPMADGAYFSKVRILAKISWENTPNSEQANAFILNLSAPSDQFNELAVSLWMPSMGHGSIPVKIEKINPTQYRITDVYFLMPGDWDIRFTLKNNGVVIDSAYASMIVP